MKTKIYNSDLKNLERNVIKGKMAAELVKEAVELAKLNEEFRQAMLRRLLDHLDIGWSGWKDKEKMNTHKGGLKERIIRNAINSDWVDVANLAMFAWTFERRKGEDRKSRLGASLLVATRLEVSE